MLSAKLSILLVEANTRDAARMQAMLRESEFSPIPVGSLAEALTYLKGTTTISGILLDLSLPDGGGFEAAERVHRATPQLPIVALRKGEAAAADLPAAVWDCLDKTQLSPPLLVRALRYAIAEQQRQLQEAQCDRSQRLLEGVAAAMTQLLLTRDYQAAIGDALSLLGMAADVDRVYLFENHWDQATAQLHTSQRFEWARQQISPQGNSALQNLAYRQHFPRWQERLSAGLSVRGLVREFPVAAREILAAQGIRSILVTPVKVEREFWGFIGFGDCQRERHWTNDEELSLTVAAGSIGGAIAHQQTEVALRESETKFRTLYESASVAVILLDAEGVLDGNSAALETFGCDRLEQLRGKPACAFWFPPRLSPQATLDAIDRYVAAAIREGSCRFDWTFHRDNGDSFPAVVTLTSIQLAHRQVLQAAIYDMTERKATENALLEAKEAAEAGSLAKSEFLATMSHELRTPLNAVLGLSQLLAQETFGTLNEKQKEYVRGIHSSGEHLLSLINDILDLSKVEARKEQLHLATLSVRELCESCLMLVREQAKKQGLQLTLHVDPNAQTCIADERRCKQMLLNLLSNAVKFTPEGNVSLIARKQPQGVALTVEDTGIGIAEHKLPLLFEPFRQLDSGLNRRFPGTGLGLALTQSLARLHGGDVTVQSTLGEGSQFTLYLPDLPPQGRGLSAPGTAFDPSDAYAAITNGQGRILLVENDERSALVLKDYLQAIGHPVKHLSSGTDFLQQVRAFQPQLILLDVQLPGDCTGFDLLVALRQEPDTRALNVVMVTAMAMAGDRDRCLAAGADDYLSKPIGIAQLEAVLMRYLGSTIH